MPTIRWKFGENRWSRSWGQTTSTPCCGERHNTTCSFARFTFERCIPTAFYFKQAATASLTERNNGLTHSLSYWDPNFGLFGVWGYFGSIWLLPVQNLTSYSCSVTQISHKGDEISRLSRIVIKIWRGTDRSLNSTDDRRDDRNRRLLHLQCANPKIKICICGHV